MLRHKPKIDYQKHMLFKFTFTNSNFVVLLFEIDCSLTKKTIAKFQKMYTYLKFGIIVEKTAIISKYIKYGGVQISHTSRS